MKVSMRVFISLFLLAGLVWVVGCRKGVISPQKAPAKSSVAVMKATGVHKSSSTALSDLPVVGGKLNVQTAWVNIANLRIEENSGFDGEQQGEHNSGNQNEVGGAENGDLDNEVHGIENDSTDVMAPGPFTIDVASGQALIGSFDVYPGTFKKVNFQFAPNANDPFFGKTIVINGEFTSTTGTMTPFVLKSEFAQLIQTQIAGGGITVPANTTVDINVVFDLAGWFSNVDFSAAQISNGQILINASNNTALLSAFEANLAKSVDVEDGKE